MQNIIYVSIWQLWMKLIGHIKFFLLVFYWFVWFSPEIKNQIYNIFKKMDEAFLWYLY